MASISNTSTTGKMSDRAEVKLTILEAMVKSYHEALSPSVSGINLLINFQAEKRGLGSGSEGN